jgi:hypothetical protein
MKKSLLSFAISCSFLSGMQCAYADDVVADMIKVTAKNNPKCVEYYNYKGELYCSTKSSKTKPVDPSIIKEEKINIVFDDRAWHVAWGEKNKSSSTLEYIPIGETIEDWHELVTSQFYPDIQDKITPSGFASFEIDQLKSAGFNSIVTYIKETPETVIFEFRIESPKNQIQDEIQKISVGKSGLHILHYAIKVPDMGEKNREKWIKNLSLSTPK